MKKKQKITLKITTRGCIHQLWETIESCQEKLLWLLFDLLTYLLRGVICPTGNVQIFVQHRKYSNKITTGLPELKKSMVNVSQCEKVNENPVDFGLTSFDSYLEHAIRPRKRGNPKMHPIDKRYASLHQVPSTRRNAIWLSWGISRNLRIFCLSSSEIRSCRTRTIAKFRICSNPLEICWGHHFGPKIERTPKISSPAKFPPVRKVPGSEQPTRGMLPRR